MRDRKSTANLGDGLNDLRLLVPYAITVIPAHKLLAGIYRPRYVMIREASALAWEVPACLGK